MSDRQGFPIAISNPVAGNQIDLYNIEVQFEVVTGTLEQANINVAVLFQPPVPNEVICPKQVCPTTKKKTTRAMVFLKK